MNYPLFCKLAYTPEANIKYQLTEYDINYFECKFTDTQTFVAVDSESIIITFRGTTSLRDWITNFDTELYMTDYGMNFHTGFYRGVTRSILRKVVEIIFDHPGKKIYLTGHSLGGAEALVCFVELLYTYGIRPHSLVTFGAPRAVDTRSAGVLNVLYKNDYKRYVNNNDIVPHLPPEFTDMSHWGTLQYFDEDGNLKDGSDHNWWNVLKASIPNFKGEEAGIDFITDHSIEDYEILYKANLIPSI